MTRMEPTGGPAHPVGERGRGGGAVTDRADAGRGAGRPRLLDLYSGAGGAAVGYHRAGFDVVGVDHKPQKRYPYRHVVADALEYVAEHGHEFDAIHASPPCQGYSRMRHLPWLRGRTYPLLIDATRAALRATGRPWIIENVEDAPLDGVRLCGTMFGLKVYRHRLFESSVLMFQPQHRPHRVVIGAGRNLNDRRDVHPDGWMSAAAHGKGYRRAMGAAMGIDWMTREELSQAIPPAFTAYLGAQLLWQLGVREATA